MKGDNFIYYKWKRKWRL